MTKPGRPSTKEIQRLTAWLDHRLPREDGLDYPHLCGFLFAVVCAPDLVPPGEWLPELIGDEPDFKDRNEANEILQILMKLYNWLNDAVLKARVAPVLPRVPKDFAEYCTPEWERSETARWILGFFEAHDWLHSSWVAALDDAREDAQEVMGEMELNLDFLSSSMTGRLIMDDMSEPAENFETVFNDLKGDFVNVLSAHAAHGRRLYAARLNAKGSGSDKGRSRAFVAAPGQAYDGNAGLGPTETADLSAFLADARHPEDTYDLNQLKGFLFAVVSAPDTAPPSEWIPMVFGGRSPAWSDLAESGRMMQLMVRLYDQIEEAVRRGVVGHLPPELPRLDDFLAERQPALVSWVFGLLAGHTWLEDAWFGECKDADLDYEQFVKPALFVMLSFASLKAARRIWKDGGGGLPFEEFVGGLAKLFVDAMTEYSRLGWVLNYGVGG